MRSTSRVGHIVEAAVLALITATSVAPVHTQRAATFWYDVRQGASAPLAQAVSKLVGDELSVGQETMGASMTSAALSTELRRREPTDTIFVAGDASAIREIVIADEGHRLFDRLGLEVVNVRLSGAPLYLFVRADQVSSVTLGGRQLKVAYASIAAPIQGADIAELLKPLLRGSPLDVIESASPVLLATRLLADDATHLDVVGIYDQDPSTFVHEFIVAYERKRPKGAAGRLEAARLMVFPVDQPGFEPDHIRIASGGLTYAFVRYDTQDFYDYEAVTATDPAASVLTVTPTNGVVPALTGPIVITNIRKTAGPDAYRRFAQRLSDAYITALFQVDAYGNRCAGPSASVYRSYLFNAQIGDRENPLKALGLWSHLTLMGSASTSSHGEYEEQARMVEDVILRRLKLPLGDPARLAQRVALAAMPKPTIREQFSGDVSTLYPEAIAALKLANSALPAPERRKQVERARGLLITLVAAGRLPSCSAAGRGMWSANDFDPFFYLALADSIIHLEGRR